MKDAFVVAKRLGVNSKGAAREIGGQRLEELDRLMEHFGVVKARRPRFNPNAADYPVRDLQHQTTRRNRHTSNGRTMRRDARAWSAT